MPNIPRNKYKHISNFTPTVTHAVNNVIDKVMKKNRQKLEGFNINKAIEQELKNYGIIKSKDKWILKK